MAALMDSFVIYKSPLGPIKISADNNGISSIEMQFGEMYKEYNVTAGDPLSVEQVQESAYSRNSCGHLSDCMKWLDVYFEGDFDKLHVTKFPQLKIFETDTS